MWVPPRFIPDEEVVLGELEFSGIGPPISEEDKKRALERHDGDESANLTPDLTEEQIKTAREQLRENRPPGCPNCPATLFTTEGLRINTDYHCPRCGYRGDGGQNGR